MQTINLLIDPVSKFISEYLYDANKSLKNFFKMFVCTPRSIKTSQNKISFLPTWCDILIDDDWYENDKKDLSTFQYRIDDVYDKIDKRFVIGLPRFLRENYIRRVETLKLT